MYVANELGLSIGAYGKIERDEVDLTIQRLNNIAKILDTDLPTILNFDTKQVFNQNNNHLANAIVHNLQVIDNQELLRLKSELEELKKQIDSLKRS